MNIRFTGRAGAAVKRLQLAPVKSSEIRSTNGCCRFLRLSSTTTTSIHDPCSRRLLVRSARVRSAQLHFRGSVRSVRFRLACAGEG